MGKLSGALTSVVAIGVLAFVVYYCCLRRKRQRPNGTIIQVTTSRVPPATPNSMPYNPTNPGPVVPPSQYGYPYPAANYGGYPGDANGQPYAGQQYAGQQYPGQNMSYPAFTAAGGLPMPMPHDNSAHVQGSVPYPVAPQMPYNDLPPPYSDVTKR